MKYLEIRSYGKINFTLDVKEKRSDGYHNIETIIQTIDIYDTLKVEKIEKGIEILSDHHYLPLDERNLVFKAYKELSLYTEQSFGVRVTIEKHIPISAGLGGGSSNAAAMLFALDRLYRLNLSPFDLTQIAENIGMDVIFFIHGGLKYVHGKGERIEDLGDFPFDVWIVVAKPPIGISTVWAYNRFDIIKRRKKINYTKCALRGLIERDYRKFFGCLGNDFVEILEESYYEIFKLKKELENCDVKYINISGSGPSLFGVTKSREEGEEIVKRLKDMGYYATLTRAVPYPYEIVEEDLLVHEDAYRVGV